MTASSTENDPFGELEALVRHYLQEQGLEVAETWILGQRYLSARLSQGFPLVLSIDDSTLTIDSLAADFTNVKVDLLDPGAIAVLDECIANWRKNPKELRV